VVISAVTAAVAGEVAAQAAEFLRPGQIFFDVNSASPATKTKAAQAVAIEQRAVAQVAAPQVSSAPAAGGHRHTMITKGALRNVLDVCVTATVPSAGAPDRLVPLDAIRASLQARFEAWSDEGYRVLGVASRPVDARHLMVVLWAATQAYADFAKQICLILGKVQIDREDFATAGGHRGQRELGVGSKFVFIVNGVIGADPIGFGHGTLLRSGKGPL
jgi:hypothetical protein